MILDFTRTRDLSLPAHAVLVVGSGAAGLAVTERLSAAGSAVVLFESGHDRKADAGADYDDLNQGVNLGLAYTGLTDGRSRMLGGTTALWHGQCMRLHDIDVRARSWVPDSGWPFALAALDEPYAQAERWLRVTGRGYEAQRWAEHPDLPPIEWDADHLLHDFTEYTRQPVLARDHRAGLARDTNVQVVVNATVTRVLVTDGRVTGLEVAGVDGHRSTFTAQRVVLAAGAIENARLLQLSDPAGVGLGDGRRHTGRFLQDHPIVRTAQVLPKDFRVLQDRYIALHSRGRRLFPKVRLAPKAQQEHELLDATAVFVHEHDQRSTAAARRLLLSARARRRPERPWRDALVAAGAPAPIIRDTYRRYARGLSTGARPKAVWLQLWLEQAPDASCRVSLSTATDGLGLRRAQVDWRSSAQERETGRSLTRWIAADLARLGLAEVKELPAMTDDDAWHAGQTDAFHPAGTTRMSVGPEDGVVDVDLQVHGVAGLYAVGGSVFPTSGYANPTLTIVALALRLADHLSAGGPSS